MYDFFFMNLLNIYIYIYTKFTDHLIAHIVYVYVCVYVRMCVSVRVCILAWRTEPKLWLPGASRPRQRQFYCLQAQSSHGVWIDLLKKENFLFFFKEKNKNKRPNRSWNFDERAPLVQIKIILSLHLSFISHYKNHSSCFQSNSYTYISEILTYLFQEKL